MHKTQHKAITILPLTTTTMATETTTRDYLQNFLQTKSSLQARKAEQNLTKRVNFELQDGSFRIMTNAEFIQHALENQLRIAASPEKKPIDENKAERINRAFANGNYYIIVRNLGSLYKETPEMKNLEQVMKTPWSPENSAERFKAEKAAINSIIEANTPTKLYYHVQMNDKGASMPISKTMYDYGMFIQQKMVDELSPKVKDFLAKGDEYKKYEPEIFDHPHPSIIVGDEDETLVLKDNQLRFTGEVQGNQIQNRPLIELPLHEQLTFLRSAEQSINLAQKEINILRLMDELHTDNLDLPHPVTTKLINDQERSLTQIVRIDGILNFKDNDGKTIPDQYVPYTDRENIYDMAFNNTVEQLLDATNNQGLIDSLKEKVDENLRDIGLSAHLDLTGKYEGMSLFIDSYSNGLYVQDKKVAKQIEAFSFDDQLNILQQALAQTIERKANIEAINQKLAERFGQDHTVFQQTDAPLQQDPNQNNTQQPAPQPEATDQTPQPNESLSETPFQYELLDEKMKAFGIDKYDLPWGDVIELINDKLVLHGHNEDCSPRDIAFDDLSNGQKASIYNHVNEAMEKMDAELAKNLMRIAALMEQNGTDEIAINDIRVLIEYTDDWDKTTHYMLDTVSTVKMDNQGELWVQGERENYLARQLNITDQLKVSEATIQSLQNALQTQEEHPLRESYFDKTLKAAQEHVQEAFPDSTIAISGKDKDIDELSVIIDGKDTHITPIPLPMDFGARQDFAFVARDTIDNPKALELANKIDEQHPEKGLLGEDAIAFFDFRDALDFQRQVRLLPEIDKLNELEKQAARVLPNINPHWERENEEQIEGAKLIAYGVDSGIRAEYLRIAPYEGEKGELGFAVGEGINAQNIDSLTEMYAKEHPDHRMVNNGGDDLTIKFTDIRQAIQFMSFSQTLINAEPKLPEALSHDIAKTKEQHPDTLVISRNGDNYEAYGKDAQRLSSLLDLPTYYDRGFAVTQIDTHELADSLAEIKAKGQQVSIIDNNERDIVKNPLDSIKEQLRDSGLVAIPLRFDPNERRFMNIEGMVNTPFLDFSEKGNYRPETVIAPISVEYQKMSDTLLLHGQNANGDNLTIPLETPTHGNIHAYTVVQEHLQQPLEKGIQHANMIRYLAEESLQSPEPSDSFIRNIKDSDLFLQDGNRIHVGKYDETTQKLFVTETNEMGHTLNETTMRAQDIARFIAKGEAVAIRQDNLEEMSRSFPSLEEVTQKRAEYAQSEQARLNEKYLNTMFESKDPEWQEKGIIVRVDSLNTPRGRQVELWSETNMGGHSIHPDTPYNMYEQKGNKIDGIIFEIQRKGFTDREKALPYHLMDPISYSRDNDRTAGPDQIHYDGLMVDFGPNHFYFQQLLSGPEAGKYHASYEIENLNHGTREKVVDADIDLVFDKMLEEIRHYDLRENQSHSLRDTEDLVKEITTQQILQTISLESAIHNIPTGDKEMADDPDNPVMDVTMIDFNDKGEIVLHGNGGPAPLDSLDESARFEVLRRIHNDLMDQNLDLPILRDKLQTLQQENKDIDIIIPFEHPQMLYTKDTWQFIGAAVIDEQKDITLFRNAGDAQYFLDTPDAALNKSLFHMDLNDLNAASQRKLLENAIDFFHSPVLRQQAYQKAENLAEELTSANILKEPATPTNKASPQDEAPLQQTTATAKKLHLSFSNNNNMSNQNSEETPMRPDENKAQGEQQKTDPEIKNQEKAVTREAAAATILAAIGSDINKMKLADNEHISLTTNKGTTIDVQTVSVTKNNSISLYGEIEGTKKSISASQLTDDSMAKLAAHLDDLRSNKQTVAVEKPAEQKVSQQTDATQQQKTDQKPEAAQEQKASQQAAVAPQQNNAEQKADQPKERKVEPIELKPDSKVEYNITKNPVLDRVYDIQLYVDGEKKAGHHLSVEDRKAFFDNKVTGPELVPKYFEKELAGQKLPENIERHHSERKQDAAQEQKTSQQASVAPQQNNAEQKADQSKERKVEPIELKPDSKVEYNITKNPALDRVYDIQLFVDGEKKAGHHLSVEDRKAFFDNKVTGPELVPKYFEKELAGQKLPENIERHRSERKQDAAQEQNASQQAAAAQQQNADPKANVKPNDVIEAWKKATEPDKTTFIQRENANGKFYQTFGDDASKVATVLNRQAKNVTEGPNANLAYISVSQKDMPNVMKALKEQNDQIKVVGMDGKYARVLPEAQAKEQVKAADLSKYNVPEGKQVTDVKVWQYQGQAYMNGFVDGNKLKEKEISKEDWAAFKEKKATPEQIVGKYYSPAEMEAKQEVKQSKTVSR